jgi:hypothetical protein
MGEFSGWGQSVEGDGAVGEALQGALRAHEALRASVARVESPVALWEAPLDVAEAQRALREALGRLGAATLEAAQRHARLAVTEAAPVEVAPASQEEVVAPAAVEAAAVEAPVVEVDLVAASEMQGPRPAVAARAVRGAVGQGERVHGEAAPRGAGAVSQRVSFEGTWWLLREALSASTAPAQERAAKALGAVTPADSIPGVAWSRERRERWLKLLGLVCRALHEAKCAREIKAFQKALVKLADKHKVRLSALQMAQAPRHGSWRKDAQEQALRLFGELRREREAPVMLEEGHALLDQWSEASGPLWKGLLPLLERGLVADEALLERLLPWVDELEEMGAEALRVQVLRAEKARSAPPTLSAPETLPSPATLLGPSLGFSGLPLPREVPLPLLWRARLELVLHSCEQRDLCGVIATLERETEMGVLLEVPPALCCAWGKALAALVRHMEEKNVKKPTSAARTRMMQWINKVGIKGQVRALYHEHTPQGASWVDDVREHGWEAVRGASALVAPPLGAEEGLEALRRLVPQERLSAAKFQEALLALMERGLEVGEEAQALLCERVEELEGPLLAGVRAQVEGRCERAQDEDAHRSAPGAEWAFWPLVEGRHAVMVGSAGKKTQLEMLERAFRFSKLEHVEAGDQLRRLQSVAASIKPGDERVFLLMHRYLSHSGSDPIWDRRDDAVVIGVDRGFAVQAVRAGIERDGKPWLERVKGG